MSHVYLCGPNNSTMFTTCCDAAVTDREHSCPVCKERVEEETHKQRWQYAYGKAQRKGYGK